MQAKVLITPEAKQHLTDLRTFIRLGCQSVTEEDVISEAIITAHKALLAKLNGTGRGQQ